MVTNKRPWSRSLPHDLLDEAQELLDDTAKNHPNANGLHRDLIRAQALVQAAHTLALVDHAKTIQEAFA